MKDSVEWLEMMAEHSQLTDCKPYFARIAGELAALRARETSLAEAFAILRDANGIAAKARAEALEEAARLCEQIQADLGPKWQDCEPVCQDCAAAIRALKDNPA